MKRKPHKIGRAAVFATGPRSTPTFCAHTRAAADGTRIMVTGGELSGSVSELHLKIQVPVYGCGCGDVVTRCSSREDSGLNKTESNCPLAQADRAAKLFRFGGINSNPGPANSNTGSASGRARRRRSSKREREGLEGSASVR